MKTSRLYTIVFTLKNGDIAFRRPGQITQGILPYNCYLICFDMLGNKGKTSINYIFGGKQEPQDYFINPMLDAVPSVLHPSANNQYRFLFENVLKEFVNNSVTSGILLKTYLLQILYHLYIDSVDFVNNVTFPVSAHHITIKKTCAYIEQNLQNRLLLEDLCKLANMSPFHFHKVFTRTMRITPGNYITYQRLNKSKRLLAATNIPISEIALKCGFENIPYFSYVFKKHLNFTPGEFRKRHSYE